MTTTREPIVDLSRFMPTTPPYRSPTTTGLSVISVKTPDGLYRSIIPSTSWHGYFDEQVESLLKIVGTRTQPQEWAGYHYAGPPWYLRDVLGDPPRALGVDANGVPWAGQVWFWPWGGRWGDGRYSHTMGHDYTNRSTGVYLGPVCIYTRRFLGRP